MKKNIFNKRNSLIFIVIIFIFISSIKVSESFARYISDANNTSEIGVANYGELTLVETLNGVVEENNSTSKTIIEEEIELGTDILKEVYLEFKNSDVSAYLFLVIEGKNWEYDDTLKQFFVLNNKSRVLYFNLNNIWNYVEDVSSENKFIFYYEYDVNNDTSIRFDAVSKFIPNVISYSDIELINNSEIRFSAYSIQKNDELTIEESWNYLNI